MCNPNNVKVRNRYKSIKNWLLKEIQNTKTDYYVILFESSKFDKKKQWTVITQLLGIIKE